MGMVLALSSPGFKSYANSASTSSTASTSAIDENLEYVQSVELVRLVYLGPNAYSISRESGSLYKDADGNYEVQCGSCKYTWKAHYNRHHDYADSNTKENDKEYYQYTVSIAGCGNSDGEYFFNL